MDYTEKPANTRVKPHTTLRCSSSGSLQSRSASVTAVTASPTQVFLTFHSSADVGNGAGCWEWDEQGPEGDSCPALTAWTNTTPSRCFQAGLTALTGTHVFTRRSPAPPLVCSASRRAHMQPCVFPGWLCVNSSPSHTLPHTGDTQMPSKRVLPQAAAAQSHLKVNIHTWGAEPRVGREGCLCNATFFFPNTFLMTLDSTLAQCYCACKNAVFPLGLPGVELCLIQYTLWLPMTPGLCSSEPLTLWGNHLH